MRSNIKFNIFLPILSGALLYISFPQKDINTGWIAWIAFVPLFLSLKNCSKLSAFFFGILTVITTGLLIGTYFWTSLRVFYELSFLKSILVLLFFIAILGGPHYCVFSVISRYFHKQTWWRPFFLSSVWVCLEFLYSKISLQARTYLLGYTQHNITFLMPLLRFGGVYALSFSVIFFNLLFAQFLLSMKSLIGIIKYFLAPLFLFCLLLIPISSTNICQYPKEPLKISLIQTNLGHELKWSSGYYQKQIINLIKMTKKSVEDKSRLIVWPSTALMLQNKETLKEILKALPEPPSKDINLLIGARLYMPSKDVIKRFNSILLCNIKGDILSVYLKKILMPYGEYLPFQWLDIFGKKKYFPDTYTPSKKDYTIFSVGNIKFCTPICLEILYPELIRKFCNEGAKCILTFSNDDSYIDPAMPYYLLIISKIRGTEFGLPVIRETVNGYSAIIDCNGEIVKTLEYGVKGILDYNFSLGYRSTFYSKHGDIFAFSCVMLTILLFSVNIFKIMKANRALFFLLLLLCTCSFGFCPPGGGSPDFNTITGTVKNAHDNPMYKVKVRIKDSNMFYITDEKGFFIFSNVDKNNVTLTFEYSIKEDTPDSAIPSLKTAVLDLGDIGMKNVVYTEDIAITDTTAKPKAIHIKNSYDLSGMTPEDLRTFQFAGAPLEDQVKAFLGIRKN